MSPIEWPSLLTRFRVKEADIKWKFGSKIIVPTVGLISKVWTQCLNSTRIHNHFILTETLAKHYNNPQKRPLITISNHSSCLDDPLMWGPLIPLKWQLNSGRHRWSAAAQEICFTNGLYSMFFSLGKTFPIIRGKGIYQPAMDFALELLRDGQWIHFFPEGKVIITEKDAENNDSKVESNSNNEDTGREKKVSYDLKWGLARLVLEHVFSDNSCPELEVLPIYHLGMNDILPTKEPYIPRIGKRTTFYVRDNGPILMDREFVQTLVEDISSSISSKEKRIKIMKFFEKEMKDLKTKALKLHNSFETTVQSIKQNI